MMKEKVSLDQVKGAWELVAYYVEDDDGSRDYPLGEEATGYLLYTNDGFMSAQLMAAGRPEFESNSLHHPNPEEGFAATKGYHAYSGPYDFDEESQTMIHHMDVSLFPNRVGKNQERKLYLEDGLLYVSNPLLGNTIVWRKAR